MISVFVQSSESSVAVFTEWLVSRNTLLPTQVGIIGSAKLITSFLPTTTKTLTTKI